jgi:hypothetical protein
MNIFWFFLKKFFEQPISYYGLLKSKVEYYDASSTSISSSVFKDVTGRENSSYLVCVIFPIVIALVFQRGFLNDTTDEKEIVQYLRN